MLAIEEGNQVPTLVPLDKYDGRQGAISLVEIVVRGTDDPVSTGIEARYPWISKLPDGYRISRTTGRRVAAFFKGVIYRADFSRGDD